MLPARFRSSVAAPPSHVGDSTETGEMRKKLTITLDERVYSGLCRVAGPGRISRFIENALRPLVLGRDLDAGYEEMAANADREAEALEWSEALVGDARRAIPKA
jgi:hypothetical protein